MGEWTPETLKVYLDELLEVVTDYQSAQKLEIEQRFNTMDQRIGALQLGWHERFIDMQKATDERLAVLAKSLDELRRLVYIGLGIGLTLQFLIPMFHKIP